MSWQGARLRINTAPDSGLLPLLPNKQSPFACLKQPSLSWARAAHSCGCRVSWVPGQGRRAVLGAGFPQALEGSSSYSPKCRRSGPMCQAEPAGFRAAPLPRRENASGGFGSSSWVIHVSPDPDPSGNRGPRHRGCVRTRASRLECTPKPPSAKGHTPGLPRASASPIIHPFR